MIIQKKIQRSTVYKSNSGKVFKTEKEAIIDNTNLEYQRGEYAPKELKYTVKAGDSIWKIAHENGITMDNLRTMNNLSSDLIHPNQELVVGKISNKSVPRRYNVKKQWEKDKKLNDNLSIIQSVNHDDYYIVVDKKNKKVSVYDTDNNLTYSSSGISTGVSGDDYNTITYVNSNGHIISGKGNNSTPAGITYITGIGTYHDLPSFVRGRADKSGGYEDIASSFHYGSTCDTHSSNGCVRMSADTLKELSKYIKVGTKVYTLPEKEGSRFAVKDGKLNFVADNPYGNDIKGDPKRYWDDYNTYIDKSYSPLEIYSNKEGDSNFKKNEKEFIRSLTTNKQKLMRELNLDSDTYNHLANLALGIANQESKMGTGSSINPMHNYKLKSSSPKFTNFIKDLKGNKSVLSRGLGQIKMEADNEGMREVYNRLDIDTENIYKAGKSAEAILARLAYMYNTEVRGRKFTGVNGDIDPFIATLYKYKGQNKVLRGGKANPDENEYIQKVLGYSDEYNLYSIR